jgi:hypothetical protein
MRQLFAGIALFALPLFSVLANPVNYSPFSIGGKVGSNISMPYLNIIETRPRQNLIGQVASIDRSGGKIVIQTESKTSVTISFNDKTVYRRVLPGQTSLENAEQIAVSDLSVGDRILIPGGAAGEQTPVRQIIVMARATLDARRDEDAEKRKARTINGRIAAINPENKEITIQTRRSGKIETITIVPAENIKFMRYAADSLKVNNALAGSFADMRVGDFVRIVGDRSADGLRVKAEEVVSGAFARMVGTISQINANRSEVVVKNAQTGQLMTVAFGKNTTVRRIPSDVATILKTRFERDQRSSNQRSPDTADRQPQQTNQSQRQLFENLPVIAAADLKKGEAVIIIASTSGNSQVTAVSVTAGESELLEIFLRAQSGDDGFNLSPGLPGNVSGGNAADDDEPQN